MDMNSPVGKEILALVRNADYAHAGEEEAIDISFRNIHKDPRRLLLDVGCGRGGTAQYIQHKGWGKVLGIDVDSDSISYAKNAYPDVEFRVADVINCAQAMPRRFDIIYLFNTLYALDHARALEQLCRVSRESGRLIVFDYLLKARDKKGFPFKEWNPLDFSVIRDLFSCAGWHIVETEDISGLYEKWYGALVSRIEASSSKIIVMAGEEWFDFVRSFYRKLRGAIEDGLLGGAIIYADKEALVAKAD